MPRRTLLPALLPALLAALLAGLSCIAQASSAQEAGEPFVRQIEREGIAVELSLSPLHAERAQGQFLEGDDVEVRLAVKDVHTGSPMTTLFPAGWMDRLPDVPEPEPDSCKTKVEAFIGGSLLAVPELDLNVYYVLAMNEDGTISVVDPLFGFGGSKLLTMIFLDSPAQDWALDREQGLVYVSMPKSDRVAVVSADTWKIVARLETGHLPVDVELSADGRYLWVAHEGGAEPGGASGVTVIDTTKRTEVARFETGHGQHEMAFSPDGRHAFVTNSASGTVSVIDAYAFRKLRDVQVGGRPVSIAFSALGGTAWVADEEGGKISVIDAASPAPLAVLDAAPGLVQIRFPEDGRLGFAVNPVNDRLYIVDAARQRIVQDGEMEKGPDQVTFSSELAYVRHRGSDVILMVPLGSVGQEGQAIPVVDFPSGDDPAGAIAMPSTAPTIVQAPGANAVLVANFLDQAIYFYKEGMAAPMGQFSNYGRSPRAVMVVDRSLRESEPGVYRTTAKMRRPGKYELAVFVDSPRIIHCFDVEVGENPEIARRDQLEVAVGFEPTDTEVEAGQEVTLRLRVTDPETGAPRDGLEDVNVLTFLAPGIWQRRQLAHSIGEGRYEMSFTPPKPGVYYVFVEIRSQELPFNRSPSIILRASRPASPDAAPAQSER